MNIDLNKWKFYDFLTLFEFENIEFFNKFSLKYSFFKKKFPKFRKKNKTKFNIDFPYVD